MNANTETRIRDVVVSLLAFAALALWLWLWWRRAFASAAPDALLLWQQGVACTGNLRDCYNGLYPIGYPVLVGRLFDSDPVYAPALLNMGFATVSIAAFGMIARNLRVGLLATVLATGALAMHPTIAFAATNPGPEGAALLLISLGAAAATDPQLRRRSVRVAVGAGLAAAAALFRSELFLLLPIVLLALYRTSVIDRRDLLAAVGAVALVGLPQAAVQLTNGLPPWAGIHGYSLWAGQQALLDGQHLTDVAFPGHLRQVILADPAATLSFWAGNFAQLTPWMIASMLPAVALRTPPDPLDRAIAVVAVAWGVWSAGDDITLGALVLAPIALLQTARLCTDLRSHVSIGIRAAAVALLFAMSVVHGLVLHAQTEHARKVMLRVADVEALLIDSGATDAQRVFTTNAALYLPSISPHAMRGPGAWTQLPGAVPATLQPRWCTDTPECFVRSLIAEDIQFVLLDDSARELMASLEPVQRDPFNGDPPHPCLEKSAAAGGHTVLYVNCTMDTATGVLRER